MNHFKNDKWMFLISSVLIVCLVFHTAGCATIFRGTQQTVKVVTTPHGRSIIYQGVKIQDGNHLVIQKKFEPSLVQVDETGNSVSLDINYDPDPLLIADGALLFLFIVPGLVALGVDFGTGAWRNYHDPQVIYLPQASPGESTEEYKVSRNPTKGEEE